MSKISRYIAHIVVIWFKCSRYCRIFTMLKLVITEGLLQLSNNTTTRGHSLKLSSHFTTMNHHGLRIEIRRNSFSVRVVKLWNFVPQEVVMAMKYKGRFTNKLQNCVIMLIFRLWKFRNIHFVWDLILSRSYEFYYDDVTVASFINIRYGNVAVEITPTRNSLLLFACCVQKD